MNGTTRQQRQALAAGLISLAAAGLGWLEKQRAADVMEAHRIGRQQGVIEGANAMFQELSPMRKIRHEDAYQAFWHVYDKRETL